NKSWTVFCQKLVNQRFIKRKIDLNVDEMFGSDVLERNLFNTFPQVDPKNSQLKSYQKGSILWHVYRELALTDNSFSRFLEGKGIKPTNPIPKDQPQIDSVFRKIKPLVIFRYQMRGVLRMRSRKNTSLYYGVPFLYELCDGNPRALMTLMDIFLSNLKTRKNNKVSPYNISIQSQLITQFSKNYLKLITAHPDSNKLVKR